jgi:predicted nucleic acid-binding protein
MLAGLSPLPLHIIAVDEPQAFKAAEIKVFHKLSFVDCLAAAPAELRGAILVTGDRDFEKLDRRIQILWLARP